MGLGDWLRRHFSSPAESGEEDAALHEEDVTREEDADVDRLADPMEVTAPGGVAPGLPTTPAAAEAAEAEIESQEAPPDPAP